MIQGNNNILELIKQKKILITPFIEDLLQGVSYDLRLDGYFIIPINLSGYIFNPEYNAFNPNKFKLDEFNLLPKQRVLASTIEKAGSTSLDITTKIFSKSSWARHGLEVASCAGYGDPGYANHWTLEIFNKNEYPVLLQKGMVVAQIAFEKVEGCTKDYKSKYNNNGIDKVFSDSERFQMMTPKQIKVV